MKLGGANWVCLDWLAVTTCVLRWAAGRAGVLDEGDEAAGEAQGVLKVTNLEGGGHEVEEAAGRHCEVVNVSVVELRRAEVVRPEGLRAAKTVASKIGAGNLVVVDLSGATSTAVDGDEEARRGAESDEVLLGNHLRAEAT